MKPLGKKNYGSIPHLIESRLGEKDYHIERGQNDILTKKVRDRNDLIIVQEKLDGGNVGVCKLNGEILAITRSGYLASSSKYETHHLFDSWVKSCEHRFGELLKEGERICGEWMAMAVGTKYKLTHEPFVAFDIITGNERVCYHEFLFRVLPLQITVANLIHVGQSMPVKKALERLGGGGHGSLEGAEGLVYRCERNGKVDFLAKYVRHDKVDGKYLQDNIKLINLEP